MIATPGTTVRTYRGSLPDATAQYQRDAAVMAQAGWFPTSQVYAPGSWGCGYFLIALVLCLVLVGILIFVYMLIVKPDGVLVVTYQYRNHETAPVPLGETGAVDEPKDHWTR